MVLVVLRSSSLFSLRRLWWLGLVLLVLAGAATGCRPYRLPTPKGPVMPKQKRKKAAAPVEAAADGTDMSASKEPAKVQRNSYDRNGLLKKPKLERRKLKKKVGQRRIFGITF
ncbi:hypothetical protein [Hymenobacter sp. B81]|uniref:hypothetical protein n=1 Tax=Hymenobacter sp. B81 TaxID=3344878 RepID=UPI0037DD1CB7